VRSGSWEASLSLASSICFSLYSFPFSINFVGVVLACEKSVFLGYQFLGRLVDLWRECGRGIIEILFGFNTNVVLAFGSHHEVFAILVQSNCAPIDDIEVLLGK
jgi:hypothetical protein